MGCKGLSEASDWEWGMFTDKTKSQVGILIARTDRRSFGKKYNGMGIWFSHSLRK